MNARIKKNDIASLFVSHGFSLRPKSLRIILSKTKNMEKEEGRKIIKELIKAVRTVKQSNNEEDDLFVEEKTIEDAFKILPIFSKISQENVQKSKDVLNSDMKTLTSAKKQDPGIMELEKNYTKMASKEGDIITNEVNNTLIILSNFGEIPEYSFSNVKRELVVSHGAKSKGINIRDDVVLHSDIELYHRMRYLLISSGKYTFESGTTKKDGKIALSEIGSLSGKKGDFNIFGLLYKEGKR